jgi:hypothetical protein
MKSQAFRQRLPIFSTKTTTKHNSKHPHTPLTANMSNVQVFFKKEDGSEDWIANIDGDVLKCHSKLFRDMIASRNPPEPSYRIAVSGPEFNAIRSVLLAVNAAAGVKEKPTRRPYEKLRLCGQGLHRV